MNKHFGKFPNPVIPSPEMLQLMHPDNEKTLRVVSLAVDTDLIVDVLIMYTSEALNDFSGRL